MEFRDLSYLLEVAAIGNLGRAAQSLGLTQPALTKCVARLEREFGVPLLERTAKGVALTVYGERLARYAERFRDAHQDIRRELKELSTGQVGHLRIGTGILPAHTVLPAACAVLLKKYPGITLEISSGNTATLFPALRDRKLDAVLANIGPHPEPGFRQAFLLQDQVTVITRKDHPLQKLKKLNPKSLAKEQWILPAPNTTSSEWLANRMRQLGIQPPTCVVQTGTLPTLLRLVADTDLIAFQSWPTVCRTNNYGELLRPLPSDALTWRHNLGVTVRDYGYNSPAIEKFIEVLSSAALSERLVG
jgi:DNA-binding transcriptional LysR family regulator